MVLLTSSAGVQRHREHYYAQALNEAGIAALVVDSFTGRGVRRVSSLSSLITEITVCNFSITTISYILYQLVLLADVW